MEGSRTAVVLQAYRYALDPTPRQLAALASHAGARRFAYNWGLELVRRRLEARAAGQDVQVPWSLFELRREWNQAKHEVAPWWRENSQGGVLVWSGRAGESAEELAALQAGEPARRAHEVPATQAEGQRD